jgi:phenylacetic acid degradation operon negative regulatory protein
MPQNSLDSTVRSLVMRFRRQRPLRSGSLLVTILGDAIAPRGGAVTLGSLIKLAEPFGLPERLVRTSVGRLAQDDWLSARREGRQSEYALTRHGEARFAEATQRIYGEPPRDWDHRWTMLLLTGTPSKHRERIREAMLWLGFGQLAPEVLTHPSRSVADTQKQLHDMGVRAHAIVLEAASGGLDQDRQLIATGWDLAELARGYERFADSFVDVRAALANGRGIEPEHAFVIRTLLIHEYRKIHLRDPLLPHDLLPKDWIGAEAYELCRELYRRVFAAAEQHLSAHACRLKGPLRSVSHDAGQRFGG